MSYETTFILCLKNKAVAHSDNINDLCGEAINRLGKLVVRDGSIYDGTKIGSAKELESWIDGHEGVYIPVCVLVDAVDEDTNLLIVDKNYLYELKGWEDKAYSSCVEYCRKNNISYEN